MLRTKCLRDPIQKSDGTRILTTRYWPRGTTKAKLEIAEWRRELAPSVELLRDWKQEEITWPEYLERYVDEMSESCEVIEEIALRARHETITLLCFEEEGDPHCHRYKLKEMIEEAQSQA